ncbi:hypothetical protein GCK72_021500 [Caenorhabditis remanei]|uniref:F-box domain-containing protein n=1 Tax=Caenorhabditis remanei TaxID=31234 RepID=A0A6A5GK51_CAERE|nr:hypothetical protein GCK72_021500 [Caenorhabditis remanei]KAF1754935.1 hypothetical protein GCK72_021500 [Caenorhabditis remanei]
MTPFPLLTLPTKILQDVVQNLEVNDLIALSVLSKRTTMLVTPNNFFVYSKEAKIGHIVWIRFYMHDWLFAIQLNTEIVGPLKSISVDNVKIYLAGVDHDEEYAWDYAGSSIGNWIKHLLTIKEPYIDITCNDSIEKFHSDSIRSIFPIWRFSYNYQLRIPERFQPLWMKHKANPRLEHLAFIHFQGFNEETFFKGINYVTVDEEEERFFCEENERFTYSHNGYRAYVSGGYDIKREDGTRMSIFAYVNHLEFVVWN